MVLESAFVPARQAILIAFFAYVLLDLGCPLLPGAFSFDPDESVEAVSAARTRAVGVARIASLTPPVTSTSRLTATDTQAAKTAAIGRPAAWRSDARRDTHYRSDSRSSIDDD
jgi:hypothetical protein